LGPLRRVGAASVLARYGREVVVLDKAVFPSDTLSTHLLFPTGVDELRRMGALERILALNPSRMRSCNWTRPG
jgi:flavin-dependent dehydrogenase